MYLAHRTRPAIAGWRRTNRHANVLWPERWHYHRRETQWELVAGGEWALIGPDGYLRVDVRAQVETHDGAHIYVQYVGLLEMNEAVQRAIETEGATQISDQHFYVNPRMETGDERYAWVNTTFFVGEGRIAAGLGVEYQIWRPA